MSRPMMTLAEAESLPVWKRPETLLYLMVAAMPLSFATWSALLNNFVIEVAAFTGKEIGGLYWFGWWLVIAGGLYILDQLFFALSFSLKTYFQKIADPRDIAPTAAVAFTINHIAAVFLPAALGYLWAQSPDYVFVLGAGMALFAFGLICLIPRHPSPGYETVFSRGLPHPAE